VPNQLLRTGFIDWSNPKELRKVERHIEKEECAHVHLPLKEVILHGPLEGSTPLAQACSGADELEAVKIIIEEWGVDHDNSRATNQHPYDIFLEDNYPLLVALRNGNIEIAKYLVEKGADVNDLIEALVDLNEQLNPILTLKTLVASLKLVSQLVPADDADDPVITRSRITVWMSELVFLIAQSTEMITHEVMCHLHRLVQDSSLLLTICTRFPNVYVLAATVRLLLEVGADPKASDEAGNNALHILAGTWLEVAEQEAVLNELLAEVILRCKDCCKVNLYQVNANNETPSDVWRKQNNDEIDRIILPALNQAETKVPPLACLSATVVRRAEMFYDGESLPLTLHPVVGMH